MAGEIGHLVHDPTGPLCACGRRGCLELYASGSGVRRQWAGTAAELFEAANSGDTDAARIRDELISGISQAISLLAYSVDVSCVLVKPGTSAHLHDDVDTDNAAAAEAPKPRICVFVAEIP